MSKPIIEVQNLSKLYRLGTIGVTTIRESAQKWWHKLRGEHHKIYPTSHKRLMIEPDDPQAGPDPNTMWALKDVSFKVNQGEIVGIIGQNGSGKSTLLKILSKITEPTLGKAHLRGRVSSLLEVGTGFHPELTGRENIYLNGAILGMRKSEIDRKFNEIVSFSEIEKFIDTPVKHYSSGMYVRLAFAVAAHLEPEILLVDEVLAVGDIAFQKKCLGKMNKVAKEGRTVLLVSHNMGTISNLCKNGMVFSNGRLSFAGISDQAIEFYNINILAGMIVKESRALHVAYDESDSLPKNSVPAPVRITRIEVLDKSRKPKRFIKTWDDIVFRIQYFSDRRIERGSVVFELKSLGGSNLLLLSTQPDWTLPLTIEPDYHSVDLFIERIPFSSGDYFIGAALAYPNTEWIWRNSEIGKITVLPCDVYGSGLAPASSRALIAVTHDWRIVS
jgi:lipopolysaccharide transport system ATP-binding protein